MSDAASSLETRLSQFWDESTPQEQELLAYVLVAPEGNEVQGFATAAANQALMWSILSNIASMKHESLKSIAGNLRG